MKDSIDDDAEYFIPLEEVAVFIRDWRDEKCTSRKCVESIRAAVRHDSAPSAQQPQATIRSRDICKYCVHSFGKVQCDIAGHCDYLRNQFEGRELRPA